MTHNPRNSSLTPNSTIAATTSTDQDPTTGATAATTATPIPSKSTVQRIKQAFYRGHHERALTTCVQELLQCSTPEMKIPSVVADYTVRILSSDRLSVDRKFHLAVQPLLLAPRPSDHHQPAFVDGLLESTEDLHAELFSELILTYAKQGAKKPNQEEASAMVEECRGLCRRWLDAHLFKREEERESLLAALSCSQAAYVSVLELLVLDLAAVLPAQSHGPSDSGEEDPFWQSTCKAYGHPLDDETVASLQRRRQELLARLRSPSVELPDNDGFHSALETIQEEEEEVEAAGIGSVEKPCNSVTQTLENNATDVREEGVVSEGASTELSANAAARDPSILKARRMAVSKKEPEAGTLWQQRLQNVQRILKWLWALLRSGEYDGVLLSVAVLLVLWIRSGPNGGPGAIWARLRRGLLPTLAVAAIH